MTPAELQAIADAAQRALALHRRGTTERASFTALRDAALLCKRLVTPKPIPKPKPGPTILSPHE